MTDDEEKREGAVVLFIALLDITRAEAEALVNEGHTTVEEIAYVPIEELSEVRELNEARILEIRQRAVRCMSSKA